jgi:uridine monophosphate synthetase
VAENFFDKLSSSLERTGSALCVGLDPRPQMLPERFRLSSDPLFDWNLQVIEATQGLAAAYKPNIAFYEAIGRNGYDLLKRTIEAVPADTPVILDAKRGDIGSTAEAYAQAIFDVWGADAVTVNPFLGRDSVRPFVERVDKGVFLLCHTSNPGAVDIQELPSPVDPLYLRLVREIERWSEHGNVGIVVGATFPESIARVRELAPQTWMLIPGVGAQGGDLEAAVRAGKTAAGGGVLINVSRGISLATDIRASAENFHRRIAEALGMPPLKPEPPALSLVDDLVRLEAIKFGDFLLASGKRSSVYIDLRRAIGDPTTMRKLASIYAEQIARLQNKPDLIAAVPYGALPIAAIVSQATGLPLIYPRKEVKDHGTRQPIEGIYSPGDRAVLVEDLVTSGGSVLDAADKLRAQGIVVSDAVVYLDRESGARERLAEAGIALHASITLSQLLKRAKSR